MAYQERASRVPGAVLWTVTASAGQGGSPVLPDGCMDLLWWQGRLVVAGPDTRAHRPGTGEGTAGPGSAGQSTVSGVRFAPGTLPALLGTPPAHELRDRRVPLEAIRPDSEARRLAEEVGTAASATNALDRLASRLSRQAPVAPDPLLLAVVRHLGAGSAVSGTADAVGLSTRALHRRSLAAFGYGPKTLARILRLQRALALARSGTPFAEVAVCAGFADQAHLAREVRELTGSTLGELTAGKETAGKDRRERA